MLGRLTALLLLLASPVFAQEQQMINLMEFRTEDPDTWERVHRQSDSRPLSLEELEKLAAAGISSKARVEMMRTRGVLALADAGALIRLKEAGADDAMLTALSAYAVPPNDHFDLRIQLDVNTPRSVRQAPFLYVEVWHTELNRPEAFLFADVRGLLKRGLGVTVAHDRSDPLLPETIRSVGMAGAVKSRHPGKLELRVLVSQRPGLSTLSALSDAEVAQIRRIPIDYPAVSLERSCQLDLVLDRDAVMADTYSLRDPHLRCYWD